MAVFWAYGQANWGFYADGFENHNEPTISKIQDANYIWFLINMAACSIVMWHHNLNATQGFKK